MIDLSQEFHPQPKVYKKPKAQKPLNKSGAKTTAWKSTRETLKEKFEKFGITECELRLSGCWKNNALTFAHIDKRRYLKADELTKVVVACTPCHEVVEKLPHKEMRTLLEKVIDSREWR